MSKIKENVDITNLSNFKTKAVAKYYFEINNELDLDNLKEVIIFAQKNKLKYLFIGAGTNILFAFDIFEGILIKNNLVGWNYNIENKNLITYSNELISDISQDLKEKYGQNIFERFIGLPGSVGGAIYGNAGCFGLEISSNLLEIKVLNLDLGKIEILKKQDLNFTYRSSLLKEKQIYFLISAKFDLSINREKYSIGDIDIYDFRQNKQPNEIHVEVFLKILQENFLHDF